MTTKTHLMNYIDKLFDEQDKWSTEDLYERLSVKYRYHPSRTQIGSLMYMKYTNLNKLTSKRAIWVRK